MIVYQPEYGEDLAITIKNYQKYCLLLSTAFRQIETYVKTGKSRDKQNKLTHQKRI